MTTYYVRVDGNDTTGNGSTGTPWATVEKALGTVATNAAHTIKIGDGVYQGNTGGLQYLLVQRNQTDGQYLTVEAELGAAGDVTLDGGTSATYRVRLDGSDYIKFNYIKFASNTDQSADNAQIRFTSNNAYIEFNYCTFIIRSVAGRTIYGLMSDIGDGQTLSNVIVNNCTFSQTDVANTGLLRIGKQHDGATVDTITVQNCSFATVPYYAINMTGATNVLVDNITASNTSNVVPCVSFGANGDAGRGCEGIIRNSTISSTIGHSLLIGAICTNFSVINNTIYGGDNALVIKHCNNITITSNYIDGGTANALYFKGATTCTASLNKILNNNTGKVMTVGASEDATASGAINFQNNKLFATGTSALFNWGVAAGDSGASVCDYNTYKVRGAGWGSVYGTTVTSLATLRGAWATYDVTTNDSHSKMWSDAGAMLLFMKRK